MRTDGKKFTGDASRNRQEICNTASNPEVLTTQTDKLAGAKKYFNWALTIEGTVSLVTTVAQGARTVGDYFWNGLLFLGAMWIAGLIPALIVLIVLNKWFDGKYLWLSLVALCTFGAIIGIPMGIKGLTNPGDGNGFRFMGGMVFLVFVAIFVENVFIAKKHSGSATSKEEEPPP